MAAGRLRLLRRSPASMCPPLEDRRNGLVSFQTFRRCLAEGAACPAQSRRRASEIRQGLGNRGWGLEEINSNREAKPNEWLAVCETTSGGMGSMTSASLRASPRNQLCSELGLEPRAHVSFRYSADHRTDCVFR